MFLQHIKRVILKQFCIKKAYGVITTHYQNLKHFADSHEGVVNGAMLYDRHQMQALFQLQIGQPGSSFAIEIARKIGLPEQVIHDASEIVGSDYIQSDKYLQDIVRDKRYWESKRQTIHQREKQMEQTISKYESELTDLEKSRKEVLAKAKERAEELFKESNKKIENVIREIREKQAEKEETKRIREELNEFKSVVADIDTKAMDEKILGIEDKMKEVKANIDDIDTYTIDWFKSLKKKYKSKGFAAGCSREVIAQGAEMLGWDLDTLIERTILAMRASEHVD